MRGLIENSRRILNWMPVIVTGIAFIFMQLVTAYLYLIKLSWDLGKLSVKSFQKFLQDLYYIFLDNTQYINLDLNDTLHVSRGSVALRATKKEYFRVANIVLSSGLFKDDLGLYKVIIEKILFAKDVKKARAAMRTLKALLNHGLEHDNAFFYAVDIMPKPFDDPDRPFQLKINMELLALFTSIDSNYVSSNFNRASFILHILLKSQAKNIAEYLNKRGDRQNEAIYTDVPMDHSFLERIQHIVLNYALTIKTQLETLRAERTDRYAARVARLQTEGYPKGLLILDNLGITAKFPSLAKYWELDNLPTQLEEAMDEYIAKVVEDVGNCNLLQERIFAHGIVPRIKSTFDKTKYLWLIAMLRDFCPAQYLNNFTIRTVNDLRYATIREFLYTLFEQYGPVMERISVYTVAFRMQEFYGTNASLAVLRHEVQKLYKEAFDADEKPYIIPRVTAAAEAHTALQNQLNELKQVTDKAAKVMAIGSVKAMGDISDENKRMVYEQFLPAFKRVTERHGFNAFNKDGRAATIQQASNDEGLALELLCANPDPNSIQDRFASILTKVARRPG
jgi:hypothetical protein